MGAVLAIVPPMPVALLVALGAGLYAALLVALKGISRSEFSVFVRRAP
jgi:hypothetical protein